MNDDLISRSALLNDLEDQTLLCSSAPHDSMIRKRVVGLKAAKMVAIDAPTIDAAPVVRCKDCIYRGGYDCPLEYAIEWGIGNATPSDDDYCSEGVRMDAPARAEGEERNG